MHNLFLNIFDVGKTFTVQEMLCSSLLEIFLLRVTSEMLHLFLRNIYVTHIFLH